MSVASQMRDCLERGDADGLAKLWAAHSPHLARPMDRGQAQIMLHRARTEAASIALHHRVYSHHWLTERGLPSGLPPELQPEPFKPKVIEAVGIAVRARSESSRPLAAAVHDAMRDAVLDVQADGVTDPAFIKARMMDAREKVRRQ